MCLVTYHHGNLREALVEAGVELASTGGPGAVTLRAVSRAVGVSHNAAYRHFTDHEDLLRAVTARTLTRWSELMSSRIRSAATGRSKAAAWTRLEAAGRAYVEFAVSSPGLFAMACNTPLGGVETDSDVPHSYTQLSERLDELVAVGALTPRRRRNAEIAAWSAVHGFAMLVIDGPLRQAPAVEREAALDEVLRVVREGL